MAKIRKRGKSCQMDYIDQNGNLVKEQETGHVRRFHNSLFRLIKKVNLLG